MPGVAGWIIMIAQSAAASGDGNPPSTDQARAVRAVEAPRIDGRLDDPAWAKANPIGGFTQRDPVEGIPASLGTEARVVFTDQAIYIAVRALDPDAASILAPLARRDERPPGDWIGVMLDSQFDRRTGFEFAVNPAGVRRDSYRFNDFEEDVSWDGVWEVAVSRDPEGWSAEFRIPLSQLRFVARPEQRFGFNVYREVGRTHEVQQWRLMSKNQRGVVSAFGDLTGLDGLRPSRRLEVAPFIAGRMRPAGVGGSEGMTGGGDLRLPLASGVSLAASINPDFGQVEADPAVVNLSATEIFFAERRPLFVEGADFFRFSLTADTMDSDALLYTRRIGATSSIRAASKILGRTSSSWSIGGLGALTENEGFVAGRLSRDLNEGRTLLGGFATLVQRDPGPGGLRHESAMAGALTGSHRFGDGSYLMRGLVTVSRVAGSREAITLTQTGPVHYFQRPDQDYATVDSTRTSLSGAAAWIELAKDQGPWVWSTKLATRSPGFEVNDAGFMAEAGRHLYRGNLMRRWLAPGKTFLRGDLTLETFWNADFGGVTTARGAGLKGAVLLKDYTRLSAEAWRALGGADPIALRGGPAVRRPGNWFFRADLASDPNQVVRGRLGAVYRPRDQDVSTEFRLPMALGIRPSSRLDLELTPSYEWNRHREQYVGTGRVAGDDAYVVGFLRQQTFRLGIRGGLTFTPRLTLQAYAEPFATSGEYAGFSRVLDAGSLRPEERVGGIAEDRISQDDQVVRFDLDGDATPDLVVARPDFTVLSVRSTVVLRWEYRNASAISFVIQHDRQDHRTFMGEQPFDVIGNLGSGIPETRIVLKASYWFML